MITNNQFLGREPQPEVTKILNDLADKIDELPEFGSEIIKWDIVTEKGGDHLLPPVLLLRNFLELIDGISALIRKSCVEPCKSLLRTALETLFYLDYMLQTDQERRAICFLVWNTQNKIKLCNKLDETSEMYKQMKSKYQKDKILKNTKPLEFTEFVKKGS